MRPNPQERRCPAPGSHVGIATERFDQAGEAVRSEKSLGRLQPRLVGSLRKCEEEAFAQGYCSLYPRVSNTRACACKNVYNVANLLRPLECRLCHESDVPY